ncbi:hypothetical protein HELRODRAFT_163808 [Helobdella robusta]|uniref:Uncharacterized protein n=1 Tax=Helobdella robusta TaxID=6412 RepID=T1EUI0_HELRO|nr:hypothetical protein HELRODRAFT_163808 [Helobdella robusta]ESN96712.1 hypothetical protein HELRODRAFT_163808 [Helobdella robusta]
MLFFNLLLLLLLIIIIITIIIIIIIIRTQQIKPFTRAVNWFQSGCKHVHEVRCFNSTVTITPVLKRYRAMLLAKSVQQLSSCWWNFGGEVVSGVIFEFVGENVLINLPILSYQRHIPTNLFCFSSESVRKRRKCLRHRFVTSVVKVLKQNAFRHAMCDSITIAQLVPITAYIHSLSLGQTVFEPGHRIVTARDMEILPTELTRKPGLLPLHYNKHCHDPPQMPRSLVYSKLPRQPQCL